MVLRVVFMGTPEFAVPSLSEIISAGHNVVRVYTQPPRKAGRGQNIRKSPVHELAENLGLEIHTPESFRKSKIIDALEDLDADIACIVAYGQILPQRALNAPKFGCFNLHGSKLPRWRGAAPIERAIMAGDKQTAAQIMQMEVGLDTGPILLSETINIADADTAGILHDKMAKIGASLWPRALAALQTGGLTPKPQIGEPVYAKKISKSETRIDWTKTAHQLDCHIRGLSPFHGAWCEMFTNKGLERVKILLAKPENEVKYDTPGEVLDDNLLVATSCGALRILHLQPAGKKPMPARQYLLAKPQKAGQILP